MVGARLQDTCVLSEHRPPCIDLGLHAIFTASAVRLDCSGTRVVRDGCEITAALESRSIHYVYMPYLGHSIEE